MEDVGGHKKMSIITAAKNKVNSILKRDMTKKQSKKGAEAPFLLCRLKSKV